MLLSPGINTRIIGTMTIIYFQKSGCPGRLDAVEGQKLRGQHVCARAFFTDSQPLAAEMRKKLKGFISPTKQVERFIGKAAQRNQIVNVLPLGHAFLNKANVPDQLRYFCYPASFTFFFASGSGCRAPKSGFPF